MRGGGCPAHLCSPGDECGDCFGWRGGLDWFVAAFLVAESACDASVVWGVASAVCPWDEVVGFGAVGLEAFGVVEFGVACWAVGDA